MKERERNKFLMYSMYAWGAPLVLLVVSLLMDLHPDITIAHIKPEFGVKACWFKSKYNYDVLLLLTQASSTIYKLIQTC
jgi:hypothetical protein